MKIGAAEPKSADCCPAQMVLAVVYPWPGLGIGIKRASFKAEVWFFHTKGRRQYLLIKGKRYFHQTGNAGRAFGVADH